MGGAFRLADDQWVPLIGGDAMVAACRQAWPATDAPPMSGSGAVSGDERGVARAAHIRVQVLQFA